MSKVFVLYYSAYGHIEKMAEVSPKGLARCRALRSRSSVFPS
jgi:hypothetical protein